MELNNSVKDVIGYLRAVNVVLVLWNFGGLRFPLDSSITGVLSEHEEQFEEILTLVTDTSGASSIMDEMRSAIDDIVDPSKPGFWDREWTTGVLCLYSSKREWVVFHYETVPTFHQELVPILVRVLVRLVDSALWLRIDCFERQPLWRPSNPIPGFLRIFTLIQDLVPSDVKLAPAPELFRNCWLEWFHSQKVQRNLSSLSIGDSQLHRVVSELEQALRVADPDT
jgi:hypothetical protein